MQFSDSHYESYNNVSSNDPNDSCMPSDSNSNSNSDSKVKTLEIVIVETPVTLVSNKLNGHM